MNDKPAFLAFRYSDGTWTVMIVSEDAISEVQDMTAAKLIEIIESLEIMNEAEEKDWWDVFH
ncbi:hypothetical protein [Rhizobium grahamii]|uniref:Uncharacterized protein n=1 Tax=Rhizobium grahamii TaxID=1120045 RepID=A0A370KLE9_9HYPH|nr:hypothetical protein [Rhizobium grahamii]RDJ08998.1 hypothetical protein B5K06_20930 [Rhizobium grahamii]